MHARRQTLGCSKGLVRVGAAGDPEVGVIIPAVVTTSLFFLFVVGIGLKAQRKKVSTGQRGLVGTIGTARSEVGDHGSVFVRGEHWKARSSEPIASGSQVQVIAVDGLTLIVKQASQQEGQ